MIYSQHQDSDATSKRNFHSYFFHWKCNVVFVRLGSKVSWIDCIFQVFVHSFIYFFCRKLNTVFKIWSRGSELLQGSNLDSLQGHSHIRGLKNSRLRLNTHTGIFSTTLSSLWDKNHKTVRRLSLLCLNWQQPNGPKLFTFSKSTKWDRGSGVTTNSWGCISARLSK